MISFELTSGIVEGVYFGRFRLSSFTKLMRALICTFEPGNRAVSRRERGATYELSLATGVDVGV